jgi:hypothetical protein
VGFTRPKGLDKSNSPTLFLTGARELSFVRRSAVALAQSMPNGVDKVATGMGHDWPLRHPDLFSRTIDSWLTDTALPPEIALAELGSSSIAANYSGSASATRANGLAFRLARGARGRRCDRSHR